MYQEEDLLVVKTQHDLHNLDNEEINIRGLANLFSAQVGVYSIPLSNILEVEMSVCQ